MAVIVSNTANIEGRMIAEYLAPLFSKQPDFDSVVADIQQQAATLGADAVVGFHAENVSPKRFVGQGTAVKLS